MGLTETQLQNAFQNIISSKGVMTNLYPITRTFSNMTGDETLVTGAGISFLCLMTYPPFDHVQGKEGHFEYTNAQVMTNGSVVIHERDVITYGGSEYEVKIGEQRRLNGSVIYTFAGLYHKA